MRTGAPSRSVDILNGLSFWRAPLSRLADAAMLLAALAAAVVIWNVREAGRGNALPPDWLAYNAAWLLLWFVLALGGLQLASTYASSMRTTTWLGDCYAISSALSIASVLTLAVGYLLGEQSDSRFFFVLICLLSVAALLLWRVPARLLGAWLRQVGVGRGRVLIVGGGPAAERLIDSVATNATLGYDVVGYVADTVGLAGNHWLGRPADVERLLERHAVNEVIIAGDTLRHGEIMELSRLCSRRGLSLKLLPDIFEMVLTRVSVEQINGYPVLCLTQPQQSLGEHLKRAMDLVLATTAVLLLAPIGLAIALLIRLDSPGPVIFRQTRVGRHGQLFTLFKFRSMRTDAEAQLEALRQFNEVSGPIFKMRNDPRITRVGRWLRKLSLDELPQLLNVVRGDMSLVGPRPAVPSEVAQYTDLQRGRLDIIPGITGLWQVSGRSQLTFDEMVQLDLDYIQRRTLLLDLMILVRTIPAVLSREGAY